MDIAFFEAGMDSLFSDGEIHKKELPFLSLAQSLEGHYALKVNDDSVVYTTENGVFIAPSRKMQTITHRVNPCTGIMRIQWIFLDVLINGRYSIDDLFSFPVILPIEWQEEIHKIIATVASNQESLCEKLSNVYRLLSILLQVSTEKPPIQSDSLQLKTFIDHHYAEQIDLKALEELFSISQSTMQRRFRRATGTSPIRYLTNVRMNYASALLSNSCHSIGTIAELVGIHDPYYFSKLFKSKYGISPLTFRKLIQKKDP